MGDEKLTTPDEPDGFRLEYRAETGETCLIFKLRELGILIVESSWRPSILSTAAPPHRGHLMIENRNG